MWQTLQSWMNQASIGQSRSSVLNPIQWLLVILIGGFCLAIVFHAPAFFGIVIVAGIALTLVLFFSAYIYFGKTDPDALRSESYSLTKLAIEKRLIGDNLSGLREVAAIEEIKSDKLLTEGASPEEQQQ